MPNATSIRPLLAQSAFEPETIEILVSVFENAWEKVEQSGSKLASPRYKRAAQEIIAKRIIDMAQHGERTCRLAGSVAVLTSDAALAVDLGHLDVRVVGEPLRHFIVAGCTCVGTGILRRRRPACGLSGRLCTVFGSRNGDRTKDNRTLDEHQPASQRRPSPRNRPTRQLTHAPVPLHEKYRLA